MRVVDSSIPFPTWEGWGGRASLSRGRLNGSDWHRFDVAVVKDAHRLDVLLVHGNEWLHGVGLVHRDLGEEEEGTLVAQDVGEALFRLRNEDSPHVHRPIGLDPDRRPAGPGWHGAPILARSGPNANVPRASDGIAEARPGALPQELGNGAQ